MSDITNDLIGLVHDALCRRCSTTGTGVELGPNDLRLVHDALRDRYPHGITAAPRRPVGPDVTFAISPVAGQAIMAALNSYLQRTPQRPAGCRPCTAARVIADELAALWDPNDNWSEIPSPFRPGATLLDDVVHTAARVLHLLTARGAL
ncbi:hypothetical protein [Amycolatopsis thermoflava]|uniref:hypothetical protein n=1 Tax=Amycolatopsis thermoflava TaxID=84480 RepID=UPI0038031131